MDGDTKTFSVDGAVAYTANYLGKSYPMVEHEDLRQEIWLWVFDNPQKVAEYLESGEHGRNKLTKAMRNAGAKYAQEEKARILGYRAEDNYYYELGLIRDALTRVWDEQAWTSPPQPVEEARVKARAVSEGNNYVTTLADVSRVVGELPRDEQELLERYYHQGYAAWEIAAERGGSSDAVNARITRLVKKIQRMLGGERPVV
jgi:DNA-directed RNA polymerase specialized sigma24 family protein